MTGALALGLLASPALAGTSSKPSPSKVGAPVRAVVSPPLRLIPPAVSQGDNHERENFDYKPVKAPWYRPQRDPAVQTIPGVNAPVLGGVSFNGVNAAGSAPPDTNGRVGPNHYVQWVNTRFAIYSKTGTLLYGPAAGNTLFTALGGDCASHNDGDPIAQYDLMSDRWVLTQFVVSGTAPNASHQCIAVSQSGDPLGAYYLYDFVTEPVNFMDYPHLSIWPDGYYMAGHVFNAAGTAYVGQGYYVFERSQMILGLPARMLTVTPDPNLFGALPGDLDSFTPPPAGTANLFFIPGSAGWDGSAGPVIHVRQAVVTWGATPSLVLNTLPDITVAPWEWDLGCTPTSRDCVPQAATTTKLDGISGRFMYRVGYRNFGAYDSFVMSHTVNASVPATPQAAVRWYEVRNSASPVLFQQGTFAPADSKFRWMGSIAMDNSGNIALGYSRSSTTDRPDIYVTGRLVGDPAGTMGAEALMYASPGSQTGGLQRWGDYTAMTVDPRDGCTFWYQNEYEPADGSFNWATRIANMSFPGSCTAPQSGTITGTVYDCVSGWPIPGAIVLVSNGFSAGADASGNFSIAVPPGSYTVSAADPARFCTTSSNFHVTVTNGGTSSASICLTGTPKLTTGTVTIDDSLGNNNGVINPNECIRMTVPLSSVGCAASTGITATVYTSTPGVTVDIGTSAYPDVTTAAGAVNTTAFKFTTSAGFVCGTPIAFTMVVNSSGGTESFNFSLPTCVAAPSIVNGSLAAGDATQNIRMSRGDPAPTCAAPRAACPGTAGGAGVRFYDSYTYTNLDTSAHCITVTLTPNCAGTTFTQSAAYLTSYDPTNICTNYLADIGASPGDNSPKAYSFTAPAGATFVVVVNAVNPTTGCAAYNLQVAGLPDLSTGSGPCTDCVSRPTANALPSAASICVGGSTGLTGSGGVGCHWTPATGLSDPNSCTPTASPAVTTTYSLTVVGATGCASTNTSQATITVNPRPNAVASGSGTTCPGKGIPLTGSGGVTCSWLPTTGLSNASSCTPSAGPLVTTTYTLTVTDANGCSANTGQAADPFVNGGFETGDLTGWTIDGNLPTPTNSTAQAHTGTNSVFLGTLSGTEPNGDGSLYQTITVPAGTSTLSFWYRTATVDSITFDWQDAYVTDNTGTILATIFHQCSTKGWTLQTFDMTPYAGQTVRVKFLVHQDGFGDDTSMYVDDVTLLSSPVPAQVTVTVTPDTTNPVVTAPANVTVTQKFCCGTFGGITGTASPALAAFLAGGSATDDCVTSPTRLSPQVGGVDVDNNTCFEAGVTTVTFRYKDGAGNIGTANATVTLQMYGDLNVDGGIDASDIVIMRGYLNLSIPQGPPPFIAPLALADANHDTNVDASDLVVIRGYLNFAIPCLAP